ncbi:MAG: flagellar type III secretion system pore protein FliP [Deltaproteobacteria bacterium]|nr:flagellar type III secretion system pore protein FliP [Deltaproteobacteria bacterium]MBZ0219284.1 flagellar type III secretion system pore protein FliP [Deltaproteobacteria bacterium]
MTARVLKKTFSIASMAALAILAPGASFAADALGLPNVNLSIGGENSPQGLSTAIQIVLLLTVLTVAPAILLMMTSFTRLVIVFSLLRQALGVQQAPPNQVVVGLALFLTFFIMSPAFMKINENALRPYMQGSISQEAAFTGAIEPLREFMLKNTREKDMELFLRLSKSEAPRTKDDIPTLALIPAFVTSELKTAFQIGFLIYLPFLAIDMIVASVLMSMGMMMLPPVMVSMPFKLMLFVLVDGWYLLVGSLVQSFG